MVLLHGKSPKGAEKIAAKWADARKVLDSHLEKELKGCPNRKLATVFRHLTGYSVHPDLLHSAATDAMVLACVLLAANAMKAGMFILKPLLVETGAPRMGKMVIGTVKGDIHDIGKNLVAMMMEGAGFEVVDLGINNAVEKYLEALETEKPDILGMSALLTTTMPYMKVVIDTMKEKGLRDDYIVLVGGAPLNEEFGKAVGADAYCRDAGIAVETAKTLIAARRAAAA